MSNIYKKLYYTLFNRISYAIEALERGEYDKTTEILKQAQISSEEQYMSIEDSPTGRLLYKIRSFFAFRS